MNSVVRFSSGVFLTAVIIAGCSGTSTGPTLFSNLIVNSSFEANGAPSLAEWTASDTSLVHFSTDVPPGGGKYSVEVKPGIAPGEGAVYTTVSALAGTHIYNFSVWARSVSWAGDVYINVLKLDPPAKPILIPGPVIQDSTWTMYTATDTVTANTGDSITVGLEAGSGNVPLAKVYFDLCTFTPVN